MTNQIGGIDGTTLKQIIERIERLEEDKSNVQEDIKQVFGEAKSSGFDVKIIKEILKLRKLDHSERYERETMTDIYKQAIGMSLGDSSGGDTEEAA